jgi:hypothetical protein
MINDTTAWTILAPNDMAFNETLTKLNTTAEQLLNDTALLTAILEYHVIPAGAFKAANLTDGMNVTTALVDAGNLTIGVPGNGTVTFTGANGTNASVVTPDIGIGASVVHIIDTVLMPPLNATVNTTGLPANLTSPAPMVEASPAPAAGAAGATTASPAPMEMSPAPMESPAPVAASPAPMEASPAPVEASPAPVEASPAPVAASPAPVEASPAPVNAAGASPAPPLVEQAVNALNPGASPAP